MATKNKLEAAVEKKAADLNDAQRELVMSQLSMFKKNRARMAEIDDELNALKMNPGRTREEAAANVAHRSSLTLEKSQLMTANSNIASKLFEQMEDGTCELSKARDVHVYVCDGNVPSCEKSFCKALGRGDCEHTAHVENARYEEHDNWSLGGLDSDGRLVHIENVKE